MRKTLITVPIARSSCPCVIQAVLGAGLCAVGAWLVALWVGVVGLLLLAVGLRHDYMAQPTGLIRLRREGSELRGGWLLPDGEIDMEYRVRCDYLGPWLMGLRVGRKRLWLWPDSLSYEHQRSLRLLCHRPGS